MIGFQFIGTLPITLFYVCTLRKQIRSDPINRKSAMTTTTTFIPIRTIYSTRLFVLILKTQTVTLLKLLITKMHTLHVYLII